MFDNKMRDSFKGVNAINFRYVNLSLKAFSNKIIINKPVQGAVFSRRFYIE